MLNHRHGDAHNVGLLEAVGTNNAARNLTGDNHQGHGVHIGGSDAGNRVGCTRARGNKNHAYFAGSTGIAICHMRGALLVACEHMVNLLAVVECVVDFDSLATRVAKDGVYAFCLKRGNDGLRTGECFAFVFCGAAWTKWPALDGALAHREFFLECHHER